SSPFFVSLPSVKGIDAGSNYTYAVEAKDLDQDKLSYNLKDQPTGMTLNGAIVTWKPDDKTPDSVTYKVVASDGKGGTATETMSVTVCKTGKHFKDGWCQDAAASGMAGM
ncbi:MAG: putative Ig domain-containing protein, partial [Methylococcales bacterium]|nr:putative Ig domain-containing protein [Methylococcales bacterium]